jgi:hypothetical protein
VDAKATKQLTKTPEPQEAGEISTRCQKKEPRLAPFWRQLMAVPLMLARQFSGIAHPKFDCWGLAFGFQTQASSKSSSVNEGSPERIGFFNVTRQSLLRLRWRSSGSDC